MNCFLGVALELLSKQSLQQYSSFSTLYVSRLQFKIAESFDDIQLLQPQTVLDNAYCGDVYYPYETKLLSGFFTRLDLLVVVLTNRLDIFQRVLGAL